MSGTGAFIFDMDGTLVDNMSYHIESWLDLFNRVGVPLDASEFHRQVSGKTTGETLRQLIRPDLTEDEVHEMADYKERAYRAQYGPHLTPVAGLMEFLEPARQAGIPMAVATGAGQDNIEFVLGGLGLYPYFQVVVGGENVRHSKPSPDLFLLAAHRLGIDPARCLVFEDAPLGIEAARRAGMKVVAVMTTMNMQDIQDSAAVCKVIWDYGSLDPRTLLELINTEKGPA